MQRESAATFPPLLLCALLLTLLLGGTVGLLESPLRWVIVGGVIMVALLVLRQNEIIVTLVIAVQIYLDWYVGLSGITLALAPTILVIFYLARSQQVPWTAPRALWLWLALLAIAIFPGMRGITFFDGLHYYFDIIFDALIIFWLGTVVSRDEKSVRRFLQVFALFGALIALHAIIQEFTGVFLFKTTHYDDYLLTVENFEIGTSGVFRVASFLINPDTGGAFFATMLFIPLALFVESSSLPGKVLYLVEVFFLLLALLFSYSTGGWVPTILVLLVFVALIGRTLYRVLLPCCTFLAAIIILALFPLQAALQLQHAGESDELPLRIGAWLTGIRVIQAYPLTGVGLGRYGYFERAEPYRVPAQFMPLYHPHNSYLEVAALGGLPLALVFLLLLLFALWQAWRNWRQANMRLRTLLAGGIAAVLVLSINSLANPGWTLPPLAATGWLIFGVISSPLLTRSLLQNKQQGDDTAVKIVRSEEG